MKKLKAAISCCTVLVVADSRGASPEIRWTIQHAGPVKGCAISPDSRKIAAGTNEGKVIIYESASGRVLRLIDAHAQAVNQVAFSPNSLLVASTSNDNSVRIWRVEDGQAVRAFTHTQFLYPVVFGLDSRVVFAGGGGGFIRSWNIETGGTVRTFTGETTSILALDLSTDGTQLVSGSAAPNNRVRLWNASAGSTIQSMTGHTSDVRSLRFSPSGAHMVSASADHTVKLWETATGRARTYRDATAELFSAAFSRDSQYLVAGSGSPENMLRFWNAAGDFALVRTFNENVTTVNTLHFSAGGSSFVFCTESGSLTYAWNPFVAPLTIGTAAMTDAGLTLTWSGGVPPYQPQRRANFESPWENFGPALSESSATIPIVPEMMFVRVLGTE